MNCMKQEFYEEPKDRPKIPRPPNAFMLYANENRKKMSQLHPTESNKEISKRLGSGWKSLDNQERTRFFERARAIGLQHKKEYPDYVYNPKEARLRKAMRDASRERSIGTSPMVPRPHTRATPAHGWIHDDLMMSPLESMDGPVCGYPSGSGHYMNPINSYSKMEPPLLPPTGLGVHANYMQPNPLAQLQQQTEMWPDYRTTEIGMDREYMIGERPYSSQSPEITPPPVLNKEQSQTLVEGKESEPEQFLSTFDHTDGDSIKKPFHDILQLPSSSQLLRTDSFSTNLKYQTKFILNYFQSLPNMIVINVTAPDGITFPYASFSPPTLAESLDHETKIYETTTEPNFIHTDVGFVPMSSL